MPRIRLSSGLFLRFVYFFGLAFSLCSSCFADSDEKAIATLRQLFESRGEMCFSTGELQYSLRVTTPARSDADIRAEVDLVRKKLDGIAKNSRNKLREQQLQRVVKNLEKTVVPQLKRNERLFTVYYAFKGPELGGDRYVEIRSQPDPKSEKFSSDVYILRRYGPSEVEAIEYSVAKASCFISPNPQFASSQPPYQLGRMIGISEVEKILQRMTAIDIQTVASSEFGNIDELVCTVEASESQVAVFKFHVVREKGFVVPLVQLYDTAGQLLKEVKCSGYFQPSGSTSWFPSVCTFTTFADAGATTGSYSFDKESAKFGHDIPDARFRVALPVSCRLNDIRKSPIKTFDVVQEVTIGVDDVDSLAKNASFREWGSIAAKAPQPKTRSRSLRVFLGFATVALLIVTYIVFKRRGGAALLLACVVFAVSGCTSHEDLSELRLDITPTSFELGEISSEQGEVEFEFDVTNEGEHGIRVALAKSCNCMFIRDTDLTFSLQSQESRKVRCLFSPTGKFGDVNGEILVDVESRFGGDVFRLPYRSTVINDWSAMPRRVLLAHGDSASIAVSALVRSWEKVSVEVMGKEFSLTPPKVSISDGAEPYETRTFRVVSKFSENKSTSNALVVRNKKTENIVLSVPVLIN